MAHTNQRRILIIDDDSAVTGSIGLHLRAAGYDVAAVNDSTQALAGIRDFSPDVILLDILMPGIDGVEVCRLIRADEALADLPVIFVSAIHDETDMLAALKMANDYVTKPFSVRELTARVYKAIQVKDLQDELKRKNEELRQMILIDEATGLYGRRYLLERLGEELARARRYFYSIACLLIEIDNAPQIRETIGIQAWTELLQEFAALMREGVRMADLVCRYDTEQFFALLPSTDTAGARIVAESLTAAVQKQSFAVGGGTRVTVSIGIASLAPNEMLDRYELISRAEAALTRANLRSGNSIAEGLARVVR